MSGANDMTRSGASASRPWDRPWPAGQLENLMACPVCASPERTLLYEGLADRIFLCAPGKWNAWRCGACGSAYLDPRPTPASIHLAYESYYTHFEAPPKSDYAALSPLRKLRRQLVNGYARWRYSSRETPAMQIGIVALLAARPQRLWLDREYRHLPRLPRGGGRLLDVGCGDGSFLRTARSCGWEVVGVDADVKAVANCVNQGFEVLEGGIERFEGQERLFDVITLSHVIEHLHDPVGALAACRRLLKTGGRLWIETPNIDSLGHRHYRENWRGLEPPRHLVLFNRRSLNMALARAGFTRIETKAAVNVLSWMSRASEAARRGQPIGAVALPPSQRWLMRGYALIEAMSPALREFLTVAAIKDEGRAA
jgi:2-polyprenyl-3-methyl-5-hydroxy-6-metoxy-1,4-benzoquinol methylase